MHNMLGIINGLEVPIITHVYDMPRGMADHTPRSSRFHLGLLHTIQDERLGISESHVKGNEN